MSKTDLGGKNGLQSSNSVSMINSSGPFKTQNLIEHGAVAAVIPSQNNSISTNTASTNQKAQSSRSTNSTS